MPPAWSAGKRRDYLPKSELGALIDVLQKEGYTIVGPTVVDGVVSLRPVRSLEDLARGLQDEQGPGTYRTREADPDLYFQHVVGPDGPKRYLFPPTQTLFGLHVEGRRFVVDAGPPEPPKLAFLGVRPCELAAMAVQDRVFGASDPRTFRCESNPYYSQVREAALVIAVNCTRPGGNCFCASMGTGPVASEGFDLAMTELRAGFVVEVGSPRGAELVRKLKVREPTAAELELAELRLAQAAAGMGKKLDTSGLPELLEAAVEHPHWDDVGKRCLGCGNCTMVCPTCSCGSILDSTDLPARTATRTRQWESCFTHQFTYTTSGPVRTTIRARYRHWLRHKLSTWLAQYGTMGCVGCGRCVTWCPVGIDLTQEVAAIRGEAAAKHHDAGHPAGRTAGTARLDGGRLAGSGNFPGAKGVRA
ncbi:MAG: 4Fe-4S ferredoxin [Phycisphaerae bacterium]